jgi:hypothetical protein
MNRFPLCNQSGFIYLNDFLIILFGLLQLLSGLHIRCIQLNDLFLFFLIYVLWRKSLSSLFWLFFWNCTRLLMSLLELIPLALLTDHCHVKTMVTYVRWLLNGWGRCSCVSSSDGPLLLDNLLWEHVNDLSLIPSSLNRLSGLDLGLFNRFIIRCWSALSLSLFLSWLWFWVCSFLVNIWSLSSVS